MEKRKKKNKKLMFFLVGALFLVAGLFNLINLNYTREVRASSCPFIQIEGRTILNFDVGLLSNRGYEDAYVSKTVNLQPGIYKITTFSYDGGPKRESQYQPDEIWKVILKNNNTTIAETRATTDLIDYIVYDEKIDVVAENLSVFSNITSVIALHAKYPDNSSPNSVNVGCIAFDFTPFPSPSPAVDIEANGSDGPITLYFKDYVTLSWASQNSVSCQASGDWSGSKSISGSESLQLNLVKTYTFTLNCQNNNGRTSQDSVQVVVKPRPPVVITKPAVLTN